MTSSLRSVSALKKLRAQLRRKRKKVVFTNGCFDILHAGHVAYLEKAKQFGDVLIVGLNTDRSVRRMKGKSRPVNHERDRARVLGALGCVDEVVLFKEDTPLDLICALKPDVLVKGSDWQAKDIAGGAQVTSWGGALKRVKLLKGRSTTTVIQRMRKINKGSH